MSKKNDSIVIIGAGIIGCTIAYELAKNGYKNVIVIERNKTIPGLNQSSTNEGTIHSGIYYPKDVMPLKAKLCVTGNKLMYKFLKSQNLPFKKVGKLIIATNKREENLLSFFFQIGKENNIKGLKIITKKQVYRLEPNLHNVTKALYIPSAGCTSPNELIKRIKYLAEENGVKFILGTSVEKIQAYSTKFILYLKNKKLYTFTSDILINAAGLYADEIAKKINSKWSIKISQVRGEFYKFNKTKRKDIWMNGMHVYEPPYCYTSKNGKISIVKISPNKLRTQLKKGDLFITAGIHLSPTFESNQDTYSLKDRITISPLKTLVKDKQDYTSNLHPARDYIKKIERFFPNLRESDIQLDPTGIMCPLVGYRDFIIRTDDDYSNCIQLIGMESPAWTSTFAIAKYVRDLLKHPKNNH
jgi:glycerol-3-phosphate dehydrogenase